MERKRKRSLVSACTKLLKPCFVKNVKFMFLQERRKKRRRRNQRRRRSIRKR